MWFFSAALCCRACVALPSTWKYSKGVLLDSGQGTQLSLSFYFGGWDRFISLSVFRYVNLLLCGVSLILDELLFMLSSKNVISLSQSCGFHISTFPPPCVSAGTERSLWWTGPHQTCSATSHLMEDKSVLVGSDQRASRGSLSKFNLAGLWAMVSLSHTISRGWFLLRRPSDQSLK